MKYTTRKRKSKSITNQSDDLQSIDSINDFIDLIPEDDDLIEDIKNSADKLHKDKMINDPEYKDMIEQVNKCADNQLVEYKTIDSNSIEKYIDLCDVLNLNIISIHLENPKLIKVMCYECGFEFITRNDLIEKYKFGCPSCYESRLYKPTKRCLAYVIYQIDIEYSNLNLQVIDTEYRGTHKKLLVKCLICDNEFNYPYNNLHKESGCRKCVFNNLRLSFEKVKSIVKSFGLTLLSTKYENYQSRLKLKCEFGHIFEQTLHSIKRARSCSICNTGKYMSEYICRGYMEYLFDKSFNKARFSWLINKEGNKLELDGYNKSLSLSFEMDGIQHIEFVPFFHKTVDNFIKRQHDDKIKDKLCKEHGITIIHVPHTVKYDNMLDYIKKECNKYNIKYIDKPNISISSFDVLKKLINEKNHKVDEKLKKSIWTRKNNYTGAHRIILLNCNNCHSDRELSYNHLIHDNKLPLCEHCYINGQNKIIDEIISKNGWERIDNYNKMRNSLTIRCMICKSIDTRLPCHIIYHKNIDNCTICIKNKIIDEIIKNYGWIRVNSYIQGNMFLSLKCIECANIIQCLPGGIIDRQKVGECKSCYSNTIIDNIIKNSGIKRIEQYIHTRTLMSFQCIRCNNIIKYYPRNIIEYKRIPKCNNCKNIPLKQPSGL